MSGGSFDYAYTKVARFSEELEYQVEKNDEFFSPSTLGVLFEIAQKTRETARIMKAVEWLYSGDTSEETFLENL